MWRYWIPSSAATDLLLAKIVRLLADSETTGAWSRDEHGIILVTDADIRGVMPANVCIEPVPVDDIEIRFTIRQCKQIYTIMKSCGMKQCELKDFNKGGNFDHIMEELSGIEAMSFLTGLSMLGIIK